MTSKIISVGILKAIGKLVLIALVLLFIFSIQTVLLYLVLSLILALILNPLVEFLRNKCKFNTVWAVITTFIILILVMGLFVLMFIPLISSQAASLSLLNTDAIQEKITFIYTDINLFLSERGFKTEELLKEFKTKSILNINLVPAFFNGLLGTLSSFGMAVASILFITFFFLKDKIIFIAGAKTIIPDSHEEETLNSIHKINVLLSRYFIGLLLQLFIVFVLYFIVLLIFGINNALIIAFLCAILNIIPYIGPLIASFLAALLSMIGHIGDDFQTTMLPSTIYLLIAFFVVQLIDNNVNQPLIFSNSTKSHPLEIFLVILTAGFISGIVGMIIAVPLYTIIKVIGKEFFPNNKVVQLITKNL
ncbi:AI-2E family transporter [Flavobacterium sp.]|uniref:AI-2E family transporter n=1 Tax=Flavobacterium sp. TaxID=239 RepID=UPI00260165F7|nr:AI-2E family transporter [Flavobacterium sp.]MDD2986193.1 AI-2E family transporter [Flavobacterium sp.]